MAYLSLDDIVNITVTLTPTAITQEQFDLGLIVGKSTIISPATRVKVYASLEEMITDGFLGTEPEYLAAQLYFSQSPRPKRVAIGRWEDGVDTAVEAVTACRLANTDWYAVTVTEAVKADIEAVAAYIEAAEPKSVYFYTTADADVPAGTAGNVMLNLQTANYSRTIGQYATTENDAVAGIMGYAMGANTAVAGSAYTLFAKTIVGVTPEDLTSAEVDNIKNANGNVYITRGATYDLFEDGKMASGTYFDEIIGLDTLVRDIQSNVIVALQASPKIPQTEDGVAILRAAIEDACEQARIVGFLAEGIWTAPQILDLNTGDALPRGYLVQSDRIADQSQVDREARKAPNIYVAVKLAGDIQSVVINVIVNR